MIKTQTPKVVSDESRLKALAYIDEQYQSQGYPPTVREIGEALGFNSPSSGLAIVRSLRKMGWISMVPRSPRTIMVTPEGKKALS